MRRRTAINNFLVGSSRIEDRIEYKQTVLRGQLGLLVFVICGLYLIIDPITGILIFLPWYVATMVSAALVIYFNRKRKFIISSSILLTVSNLLIFVIADAGSSERGIYLFFVSSAVTSLVLFYQNNLKLGLLFVGMSIFLALLAYFYDFNFIDIRKEDGDFMAINFTINFVVGVSSSVLVVLFVIKRNNESEQALVAHKDKLEILATELKAKNKALQKANDELDRFVYSTSHDLRAPLTTLLGLLEVTKFTENRDEHLKYFNMMTVRINEMEEFIKEITDYSRNTRLEINNEKVNIKNILLKIGESLSFLANDANVKFSYAIPDNLEINTDKMRLSIVLNNIISNAIKYHDPGKDNRYVKISAIRKPDTLVINIEDNGIGISNDYQDKIFDMFFRASNNSNGSGLGLYIVKETLEKLSGSISFQSQQRQGSTFTVTLGI